MTPLEKTGVVTDAPIVDDDETIGILLLNAIRRAGITWETSLDGLITSERRMRDDMPPPKMARANLDGGGFKKWLAEFDPISKERALLPIRKAPISVEPPMGRARGPRESDANVSPASESHGFWVFNADTGTIPYRSESESEALVYVEDHRHEARMTIVSLDTAWHGWRIAKPVQS